MHMQVAPGARQPARDSAGYCTALHAPSLGFVSAFLDNVTTVRTPRGGGRGAAQCAPGTQSRSVLALVPLLPLSSSHPQHRLQPARRYWLAAPIRHNLTPP